MVDFNEWSSDMAFALGFLHVHSHFCGEGRIEISTKHESFANHFNANIRDSHLWKCTDGRFVVQATEDAKLLASLGLVTDIGERFVPDVPSQFYAAYLRGVFEGRGRFEWSQKQGRFRPHLTFVLANLDFLKTVKSMLFDEAWLHPSRDSYCLETKNFANCLKAYNLFFPENDSWPFVENVVEVMGWPPFRDPPQPTARTEPYDDRD